MMKRIALLTLLLCTAVTTAAEDPKQYIYVLRPVRMEMVTKGPNEKELAALGGHMKYLDELTASGRVYIYGRTQNNDDSTFGIVVYDAANDEDAKKIMNADPAVAEGIMTGTVYPYKVAFIRK